MWQLNLPIHAPLAPRAQEQQRQLGEDLMAGRPIRPVINYRRRWALYDKAIELTAQQAAEAEFNARQIPLFDEGPK